MFLVHLRPDLVTPGSLAGTTAVVIDVLRATTTISAALANGADAILPCLDLDQARQRAEQISPRPLLGGERQGLKIDGFDLGNSPSEYGPDVVAGRQIVFTTTNGTRAMSAAADARRVLLGAFVNFSALLDVLQEDSDPIHLICAGTDGEITQEDVLLAGALSAELVERGRQPANDAALTAIQAWQAIPGENLVRALEESRGGKNLLKLDLQEDIDSAAEQDRWPAVGQLDSCAMSIQMLGNRPAIADEENSS